MDAETELRYIGGHGWKETAEIILKGLRDESLGDFLDHRLKEIASELTVFEVLRDTYFDDRENQDLYNDVHDGKPLDEWIKKLVAAIRRGPIKWPEEESEHEAGRVRND